MRKPPPAARRRASKLAGVDPAAAPFVGQDDAAEADLVALAFFLACRFSFFFSTAFSADATPDAVGAWPSGEGAPWAPASEAANASAMANNMDFMAENPSKDWNVGPGGLCDVPARATINPRSNLFRPRRPRLAPRTLQPNPFGVKHRKEEAGARRGRRI